jgi:hypothetical protein
MTRVVCMCIDSRRMTHVVYIEHPNISLERERERERERARERAREGEQARERERGLEGKSMWGGGISHKDSQGLACASASIKAPFGQTFDKHL